MTDTEIIKYYVDLLLMQYRNQPKARGHVEAFVTEVIANKNITEVLNGFDIETSVGNQLDLLAKYVDTQRTGETFSGDATLNDADFRQLIKIVIAKNNLGSSLYDIAKFLNDYFSNNILVFDSTNMQMSYFIDKALGSQDLAEIFVKDEKLPKPMGVQLGSVIYANDITSFFGMRTYNLDPANNSPFNTYSNYNTNWPWLSYDDTLN